MNETQILLFINDSISYPAGSTNTAQALEVARTVVFIQANGDRVNAPNVVVVITDGASNVNPQLTLPMAEALRNVTDSVITIGVANAVEAELQGIGNQPPVANETYFILSEFDLLDPLVNQIRGLVCLDL